MTSLWNDEEVLTYQDSDLDMRVYSSRLLGSSQDLVLHGGGNTSVKIDNVLYVKGSGWDLSSIEKEGFPGVDIDALTAMANMDSLSDSDMVRMQREAMVDNTFPNPSIEAILHAIIPFKYVDHTHADAVVTLSNNTRGKEFIQELYGENMLIIDYVMPGFLLAQKIYHQTKDVDWESLDGMILLNHGVFTFDNDAKTAYEKMIAIVDKAEQELYMYKIDDELEDEYIETYIDAETLAKIAQVASDKKGSTVLAKVVDNEHAQYYADIEGIEEIVKRGPLTPEHVIRTKPFPAIIDGDIEEALERFAQEYTSYFNTHAKDEIMLDTIPKYAIFKQIGVVVLGKDEKELAVLEDIISHTIDAVILGEELDRWESISPKDVFDMEYWELEQAKLKK